MSKLFEENKDKEICGAVVAHSPRKPPLIQYNQYVPWLLFGFRMNVDLLSKVYARHSQSHLRPLSLEAKFGMMMPMQIGSLLRKFLCRDGGMRMILAKKLFCIKDRSAIMDPLRHMIAFLSRCHFLEESLNADCVQTLAQHSLRVSCVTFHPKFENLCATGSWDGNVKISHRLNNSMPMTCVQYFQAHRNSSVRAMAFNPNFNMLATGGEDNKVNLFQLSEKENFEASRTDILLYSSPVSCIAFDQKGDILVTGCRNLYITLHRLRSNGTAVSSTIAFNSGHTKAVSCIAFHQNENRFATGSEDKTVKLWEILQDNRLPICTANLVGHAHWVTSVSFNPKFGDMIVSGSQDHTAKLWKLSKGFNEATCVKTLIGHTQPVSCIAFDSTAQLIATGSWDRSVRVWRTSPNGMDATCLAILNGHSGIVNALAFDPKNSRVLSGSSDNTAKLWE